MDRFSRSIGSVSPASKNTSRNQWRGEYCEEQALRYYLQKNFSLVRRRWKSPFAEIDLVLRDPQGHLVLIEVKSVTSLDFLHVRLKVRQKRRLERALIFCAEQEAGARLELAVVSQAGLVLTFSDIFG